MTVSSSGRAGAPIVFTAAPRATVILTGSSTGFAISGEDWITVNGFTVTRTIHYGISVSDSAHITLSNNHVSYAGRTQDRQVEYGIRLRNVTDSVVSTNTVDHNSNSGIALVDRSTRNVVRGNHVFQNAQGRQRAAAGIRLYSAPGNKVIANVSHHNEDSGIEFFKSGDNLVANNVTYANGDHGIDSFASTGQRLVGNTVYGNATAGINVEGHSTRAKIANNIAVDNGIGSPRSTGNIRVESGSTAGTTMDYDLVDLNGPAAQMIWNSVGYASLAAFKAATGHELHGLEADPRLAAPARGDFHLIQGSPAIDSADSAARGQQSRDGDAAVRVDDPGTPNTGTGPRTYDDRGAFDVR